MQPSSFQSSQVPVLETERLRLRGHGIGDLPLSAAMWADPQATRFISGRGLSEEESWSRLLRYIGHWSLLGFGYWLVEEKGAGKFVGEVGFADYHRDLTPSLEGAPEIGWVPATSAHGQGYASKVVRAVVAWGKEHFGLIRTACIIHPENTPSIRVAIKSGYRKHGTAIYKGVASLLFVRDPKGGTENGAA
jgi:RimJ/RimL family protein N-acetyltransferase